MGRFHLFLAKSNSVPARVLTMSELWDLDFFRFVSLSLAAFVVIVIAKCTFLLFHYFFAHWSRNARRNLVFSFHQLKVELRGKMHGVCMRRE